MSDLFIDRSGSRQRILKELGFASYQKYLASELWKRVKTLSLLDQGATCCCCGAHRDTVHHDRYTKGNLSGRTTKGLYPICDRCHNAIHFDESRKKLSIQETRKRLNARLRERNSNVPF